MTDVTGTVKVTLGNITMGGNGPPHTYFGVATNLIGGVAILAASGSKCGSPLAMLAAHTLECLLKAYLSRSGSDSRVRGPIQHDLEKLWRLAHLDGLRIASSPPDWAARLGELHKPPFYLRYSTGVNGVILPAAQPMAVELAALIPIVGSQLQDP